MNARLGLLILLASVSIHSVVADYTHDVAKWIKFERPSDLSSREYETFMHSANYSRSEWVVSREGDRVSVQIAQEVKPKFKEPEFSFSAGEPAKRMKAAKRFLRVDDGWLVGYNAGEFGAALWWFSTDGTAHYKISGHFINQFITTRHGIFAVEGLAHLSMTQGSMIQLIRESGKWTSKTFAALPQAAEAVAVLPDEAFVVVTTDMLLRITPEREICILVSNGDWGTLYPNSVAVSPVGRIYIGMRQFVVAHDLSDKDQKLQFLVPGRSFLHVEK